MNKQQLETLCLFSAYLIIADGRFDERKVILLESFIIEHNLNATLGHQVRKILYNDLHKITLEDVLLTIRNYPQNIQAEILVLGMIIACTIIPWDVRVDSIFRQFLTITKFDPDNYQSLRMNLLLGELDEQKPESLVDQLSPELSSLVKGFSFIRKVKRSQIIPHN